MKSIKAKIFSQFILLVAIIFMLMGYIINYSLNKYFDGKSSNQLDVIASNVISTLSQLNELARSSADDEYIYREILNFYSNTANTHIFLYDASGRLCAYSSSADEYMFKNTFPTKLINKILLGETVHDTAEISEFFGSRTFAVGKPMTYDSRITGAVVCAVTGDYLADSKNEILGHIVIAMLIALTTAAVMSYILSIQITKPLQQVSDAAKAIARGNLSTRLENKYIGELNLLTVNFNEMAEALENLEQTSKSFIANVSHELRTPMTIITGFLQGIMDGTIPPEKHREYLQLVVNETQRLTRLVNDLLEVARIESDSGKLTFDKFDINELMRVSLFKFENRILEKDLDVRLFVTDNATNVYANRDSIERVVTNLIDNAVKFAETGGYICLKTEISGDTVYISIENSGEGISTEDINKIWQRFHKSDKSRSKDKTGVGLGLYIVKNIINQHGSKIDVQSVPGRYTRFTFSLKYIK